MDTLISQFDKLAEHAQKPAVVTLKEEGMERRTYHALAESVRQLALGLMKSGLSRGDTAAIQAAPKAEWILASLAVIRAGGVVVPLDTQLNEEMLSRIMDDCGARWLFTDAGRVERLKDVKEEGRFQLVLLDNDSRDVAHWRDLAQNGSGGLPLARPEDEAAIFYTSGTTGPPKGVPLTHRNLAFQLDTLVKAGLVGEADRMLVPLPLHHVYPWVIGVLCPLVFGVPIILPRALTGPEILRAVRQGEATILIGVPRLYKALFEGIESKFHSRSRFIGNLFGTVVFLSGELRRRKGVSVGKRLFKPLHDKIGANLTVLASGGSALDPALTGKLEGLGWSISVGYGLTESAPLLTLDPPGKARIGSVGRPIPGIELRIDPGSAPEASGQGVAERRPVGEIQARGPNIFSGYRNMPEKTEESFTGDGWFRTGDLGYFDDDGYLYISGRVSTLIVTSGGENIQPDEVEASYCQNSMIQEVGILEKEDRLMAVVVPNMGEIWKKGNEGVPRAVRQAIEAQSNQLPTYMRISDFVISRRPLPRTRLGKIRRHLLPELYEREKDRKDSERRDRRPISPEDMSGQDRELLLDKASRKTWNLLVRRYHDQPLTPDTSFRHELGVDSLGWVNLTLEIAQQTGIDLDDEKIGDIETVRDLLQIISETYDASDIAGRARSPFEEPAHYLSQRQKKWLEPLGSRMTFVARNLFLFNRFLLEKVFRLKVKGIEHLPRRSPFVATPNHTSYLDPFALAAAFDFSVLQRTYWGGWTGAAFANPFNRFISRVGQVIPVDPKNAALSSLAFSASVLNRKNNLVWFPEGRRSPTGRLLPFKPGIGLLLNRFSVKVVPVLIQGTDKALPEGNFLKRLHPITVVFGKSIDSRELGRQGKDDEPAERIARTLWERIAEMKHRYGNGSEAEIDLGMGAV